jgi:hypothetical protein
MPILESWARIAGFGMQDLVPKNPELNETLAVFERNNDPFSVQVCAQSNRPTRSDPTLNQAQQAFAYTPESKPGVIIANGSAALEPKHSGRDSHWFAFDPKVITQDVR